MVSPEKPRVVRRLSLRRDLPAEDPLSLRQREARGIDCHSCQRQPRGTSVVVEKHPREPDVCTEGS